MGDNRIGHGGRNHLFDVGPPGNKVDLFLRSESPRVQQILLHQKLREEIEKSSNGKVRYVDSELYLRNQEQRRSPASAGLEVQSATLNIGLPSSTTTAATLTTNKQSPSSSGSRIPINSTSSLTARDNKTISIRDEQQTIAGLAPHLGDGSSTDPIVSSDINGHHQRHKRDAPLPTDSGRDCQVCRIKVVREDLMNLNKMIQERNVHFSELKAKCLRSYFKRQMID